MYLYLNFEGTGFIFFYLEKESIWVCHFSFNLVRILFRFQIFVQKQSFKFKHIIFCIWSSHTDELVGSPRSSRSGCNWNWFSWCWSSTCLQGWTNPWDLITETGHNMNFSSVCFFSSGLSCGTGKSFSEVLILASTNPKYDKLLSIELPV